MKVAGAHQDGHCVVTVLVYWPFFFHSRSSVLCAAQIHLASTDAG